VNQPRFWLCGLARLQHGRIAKRRLLCLYYACALRCCAAAESMIAPASARGIRCGIVVGAHHVGKTGIPASARHLLHRPYLCDWRWTCPARSDLGCLFRELSALADAAFALHESSCDRLVEEEPLSFILERSRATGFR
jgi:hypothetical protein